jgi:tyrosinase
MWGYPFNWMGDIPYTNITINTTLDFWNLLTNVSGTVQIADVMDIYASNLCYTYQ